MRPLALGRKNWLRIGSAEAGPKIAAIASIVETCHRLDLNVRAFLLDALPKLGEWPIKRVTELTPTAWKAAEAVPAAEVKHPRGLPAAGAFCTGGDRHPDAIKSRTGTAAAG